MAFILSSPTSVRGAVSLAGHPKTCSTGLIADIHAKRKSAFIGSDTLLLSSKSFVSAASPLESSSRVTTNPEVSPILNIAADVLGGRASVADRDQNRVVDTLIIGAGLSGLTLAHQLNKDGTDVVVTEGRDRVGGCIQSRYENGYRWEEGPNSFQPSPTFLKFIYDVGLKDELVLADGTLPRFVYWEGQLYPLPMSPKDINFKLLSCQGKIRAGLGAMGLFRPPKPQGEETISQFVRRNLGDEAFEKLIDPFCSGVYAGDADKLSVQAAFGKLANIENLGGSLVWGSLKLASERTRNPPPPMDPRVPKAKPGELGSFREGLRVLPETVARILGSRVRMEWKLTQFRPSSRGTYVAEFTTPDGPRSVECRSIVLTSPSYITSQLVEPLHADAAAALADIYYPPVASVSLAYPDSALRMPLRGFGNLIPRSQKVRTLGTIWGSSLFAGRAPDGWNLTTSFIGGAKDPELGDLDEETIAELVHSDLKKTLLKDEDSIKPKVVTVFKWKKAIPQMNLGHLARIERAKALERTYPGVYLSGNYVNGVALGNCVECGVSLSTTIQQFLDKTPALEMAGSRS